MSMITLALLIGCIAALFCLIFGDRAFSSYGTKAYVKGAIIAPIITGFISFLVAYGILSI